MSFFWRQSNRQVAEGTQLVRDLPDFKGVMLGLSPRHHTFHCWLGRRQHGCIPWDEIRSDHVLGNKEVFQSGVFLMHVGQSQCNQHVYSKWLYGIAHILCNNCFPMSVEKGLSEEKAQWLDKNVLQAVLLPGQKWYSDVNGKA